MVTWPNIYILLSCIILIMDRGVLLILFILQFCVSCSRSGRIPVSLDELFTSTGIINRSSQVLYSIIDQGG